MALQKPLVGLRKWLGVLESGELPTEWARLAVGTVDLDRFLEDYVWEEGSTVGAALAGNYVAAKVVPSEQKHLVHVVSSRTDTLDADQRIDLIPAVNIAQLGLIYPVAPGYPHNQQGNVSFRFLPASNTGGYGWRFSKPLVLNPGDSIGVLVQAVDVGAAGSVDVTAAIQFQRITV